MTFNDKLYCNVWVSVFRVVVALHVHREVNNFYLRRGPPSWSAWSIPASGLWERLCQSRADGHPMYWPSMNAWWNAEAKIVRLIVGIRPRCSVTEIFTEQQLEKWKHYCFLLFSVFNTFCCWCWIGGLLTHQTLNRFKNNVTAGGPRYLVSSIMILHWQAYNDSFLIRWLVYLSNPIKKQGKSVFKTNPCFLVKFFKLDDSKNICVLSYSRTSIDWVLNKSLNPFEIFAILFI